METDFISNIKMLQRKTIGFQKSFADTFSAISFDLNRTILEPIENERSDYKKSY